MSDDISKILRDAAEIPETETLKTDQILGKTFEILETRTVNGPYGLSWVATIDIDGTVTDAWLNGAVVARQLTAINEKNALPLKVTMTRDESKYGSPFTLVA
tara:strand:- start:1744 stop:2049 length:306 start_codon:yes stop_codon:yes gene_type:complete